MDFAPPRGKAQAAVNKTHPKNQQNNSNNNKKEITIRKKCLLAHSSFQKEGVEQGPFINKKEIYFPLPSLLPTVNTYHVNKWLNSSVGIIEQWECTGVIFHFTFLGGWGVMNFAKENSTYILWLWGFCLFVFTYGGISSVAEACSEWNPFVMISLANWIMPYTHFFSTAQLPWVKQLQRLSILSQWIQNKLADHITKQKKNGFLFYKQSTVLGVYTVHTAVVSEHLRVIERD